MIHAFAWYHAIAYSNRCQTTVTLQKEYSLFPYTSYSSSGMGSPTERSPLPTPASCSCRWQKYSSSSFPGQTWQGLEKSICNGKPLTVADFLTVKELSTKSCPLQSTAQDSSWSGLSRLTIQVLEGLLCASRGHAQVQCPPFKFPLASPRHHPSPPLFNIFFFSFFLFFLPMSREEIKFSKQWKCGVYISVLGERRKEPRKRAFYCLWHET